MEKIVKAWASVDGKKTYIVAGLAGIVVFLEIVGTIDAETARQLLTILGVGGIAALRDGVRKSEKSLG